jgi:hypothetical protein
MAHTSTRAWVAGKTPGQIPVKRIRPTNTFARDVRGEEFAPILVVWADDGLYYIVDGNHRFFRKLVLGDYGESILAWVLEEGDQKRVRGNPLPQHVREWKDGQITLSQLCIMAKNAYEDIEGKVKEILVSYKVLDAVDPVAITAGSVKQSAFDLTASVLRVLRGVTTIEQEARELTLPVEELASLYKCFIDGGREAIRKRLISG